VVNDGCSCATVLSRQEGPVGGRRGGGGGGVGGVGARGPSEYSGVGRD